jgi:hypothetical protein
MNTKLDIRPERSGKGITVHKTPHHLRERVKRWRAENPEYLRNYRKENRRRIYLVESLRKYGITQDQYEAIWDLQAGSCAICTQPFDWSEKQTKPHIDHDHKTGLVRGLLCNRCNTVLGLVEDSTARLERMREYLTCHG